MLFLILIFNGCFFECPAIKMLVGPSAPPMIEIAFLLFCFIRLFIHLFLTNSDLHFKSFSLFYHSIHYSAISLSNQVSMTMINWPAPGNSCSISSRVFCFTYFYTYTQQAMLLASDTMSAMGLRISSSNSVLSSFWTTSYSVGA